MPDEKQPDDERVIQPFNGWIREIDKGGLHDDLSTALADLGSAVHAHGKKGSLTLTVTLEPLKDNPEILQASGAITVKAPAARKRRASVFFMHPDGTMRRDNPNQPAFDGMEVVESGDTRDHAQRAAGDD